MALIAALFALAPCLGHAQSAEIAVSVTDDAGRAVADAVVVAVPADGRPTLSAKPREEIIDRSTRSSRRA